MARRHLKGDGGSPLEGLSEGSDSDSSIGIEFDEGLGARSRGGRGPLAERPPADLMGGSAGSDSGSSIDADFPLSGDAVWEKLPAETSDSHFELHLDAFKKETGLVEGAVVDALKGALASWLRAPGEEGDPHTVSREREAEAPL